jgi:hypothetical protein
MYERREISVDWQLDGDSPTERGRITYSVAPVETTIVFPSGEEMRFGNWDILGCRERHYREEILEVKVEDVVVTDITGTKEYGIEAKDVQRFVRDLAKRPRHERLFIVGKAQVHV